MAFVMTLFPWSNAKCYLFLLYNKNGYFFSTQKQKQRSTGTLEKKDKRHCRTLQYNLQPKQFLTEIMLILEYKEDMSIFNFQIR